MIFALDDRLARDTLLVGDLTLCRVLLMNDARWPWLILVPRRESLVEIIDLDPADQAQLMDEAGRAARFLKSQARADKLMLGITFIDGETAENEVVAHAVASGIGFGSQGFQLSDVTNYAEGKDCQGNWCDLFVQYQGQVPLQLQTKGQSQPSNAKPTGSLANLLPFAAGLHATVFEIYWEDWLMAYSPTYPGYSQYHTAYASALQAASQGK